MSVFSGVTGFDGLYLERRATQCTLVCHLNPTSNQTCQEHSCKREVPVLRYEGLRVRVRGRLTASRLATFIFPGFYSRRMGGMVCRIDVRNPGRHI